ncbi:MAG: crotonase/enoyl-CoA hydratase family protein [bacterium]|nr:crotonase/enoyl-CoA hydratase family protein [bacterium]
MQQSTVTMSLLDSVAIITMDDGKVNALGLDLIDALSGALDAAEAEARAVVLAGRPGVFSAGLDLNTLQIGDPDGLKLIHKATDVCLRLLEFPQPVVAACTGHAVALGAGLLLCCDIRICAAGDFKIGFNEVSIGIPMPELMVGLARERLSRRHLMMAVATAQIYTPPEAVEVGFLDRAGSSNPTRDALQVATDLARRLDLGAFADTRQVICGRFADTILRHAGGLMEIRRSLIPDVPPLSKDRPRSKNRPRRGTGR